MDFEFRLPDLGEGITEAEIRGTVEARQLKAMLDYAKLKAAGDRFRREPVIPTVVKGGKSAAPKKASKLQRMAAAKASPDHKVKLSAMTELINQR